jgi:RHS repeat-associated protein
MRFTRYASVVCFSQSHSSGKERDTESGNDYFGARYYASAMGRFMSPDWANSPEPVPYAKMGDPQSLNLYAFALNNPESAPDLDGHQQVLQNASAAHLAEACKLGIAAACEPDAPPPPTVEPPPFTVPSAPPPAAAPVAAEAVEGTVLEEVGTSVLSVLGGAAVVVALVLDAPYAGDPKADNAVSQHQHDQEQKSEPEAQAASGGARKGPPPPINISNITDVAHVLDRHTVGGKDNTAKKGTFTAGIDVIGLILAASSHPAVKQKTGSNYERIIDAGMTVGWDVKTNGPTSTYTVITRPDNSLKTAFPGRP